VALLAAYAIAVLATPAGISGAVLLLPFQVSVLGTPSPAVTPANLLYNVVATPGALYRYWRQHQTGGRLALVLISGTLPGVVAGSIIRVELLPSARVFDFVVAAVLLPLGTWLALTRPARAGGEARPVRVIPPPVLDLLAVAVGCVGGIYGIGGGSILAPILGEDHPDTLNSAHNLAMDLRLLGDAHAARDLDQHTLGLTCPRQARQPMAKADERGQGSGRIGERDRLP
jgi:uncharacterized membrane protein YfcA